MIAPRTRPSLEWATRAGIGFRRVPHWPYAVSRSGLVQSFHNATFIGPAIAPTPQRFLQPWRNLVRGPTARVSRGRWGNPDYCRRAFAVVELVALTADAGR